MTTRTITALAGATALTVTAVTAILGRWPASEPLTTAAAAAWILVVIWACTDRITDTIGRAAASLDQADRERIADDIVEGLRRTTPLRGVH